MELLETALPEIKVVMPRRIGDARGFFSEVWNARDFAAVWHRRRLRAGQPCPQPDEGDVAGTALRGAASKLVRVTRGVVFDVAVDIRRGSPSFGCHAAAVVTADNWYQLWIPPGYAHGYCTRRHQRGYSRARCRHA
jgi:dTDP-4-dehydrorhamnose 3,5-epimerase